MKFKWVAVIKLEKVLAKVCILTGNYHGMEGIVENISELPAQKMDTRMDIIIKQNFVFQNSLF